ncbi:CII family transcriptional regulator [Pantoea brenneri]|uniref:CII family transcriptional regulator n=1 Tax=Pantoea brenneri TaxID=472694 RepID=UPI002897C4F7|nr:CII family transcriptional regulator [Pantoea brenneri]
MQDANYSKPTQREIDRAETDLLITLSQLTGRKFADLAGWNESKVSRMNWRDIATVFCIAKMAMEVSPLGRAIQGAYQAIGQQKAPTARTVEASQITIEF